MPTCLGEQQCYSQALQMLFTSSRGAVPIGYISYWLGKQVQTSTAFFFLFLSWREGGQTLITTASGLPSKLCFYYERLILKISSPFHPFLPQQVIPLAFPFLHKFLSLAPSNSALPYWSTAPFLSTPSSCPSIMGFFLNHNDRNWLTNNWVLHCDHLPSLSFSASFFTQQFQAEILSVPHKEKPLLLSDGGKHYQYTPQSVVRLHA